MKCAFLTILLGLLSVHCSHDDILSTETAEFILPKGNHLKYLQAKRYFLLEPGDTALLYGTEACTLITNGVVTATTTDSVYFRTITGTTIRSMINDTLSLETSQVCQQARTVAQLDDSTITRYFKQTPSGIFQIAWEKDGIKTFTSKNRQMIMPNPVESGSFGTVNSPRNNWETSPLMLSPVRDLSGGPVIFEARSVASEALAIVLQSPYFIRKAYYYDGVAVMTFCTLSGNGIRNGKTVVVTGTIVLKSHYFRDQGLGEQFQWWQIRTISDKKVEVFKKSVWIARGPEGTRIKKDYSDLIP
jgi:hypothetical protein